MRRERWIWRRCTGRDRCRRAEPARRGAYNCREASATRKEGAQAALRVRDHGIYLEGTSIQAAELYYKTYATDIDVGERCMADCNPRREYPYLKDNEWKQLYHNTTNTLTIGRQFPLFCELYIRHASCIVKYVIFRPVCHSKLGSLLS